VVETSRSEGVLTEIDFESVVGATEVLQKTSQPVHGLLVEISEIVQVSKGLQFVCNHNILN